MSSAIKLPCRIQVKELKSSRYEDNLRPASWDQRVAGVDTVVTEDGDTLKLNSSGQQTPPRKGWILLLSAGNAEKGYEWTLYGIPAGSDTVIYEGHPSN